MRSCSMCGSEIPVGEYICPSCGTNYSPEYFTDANYSEKLIINNPLWGEVSIDFSALQGGKEELIEDFVKFWGSNENNPATRLALFPGQVQKISPDTSKFTLYVPDDMYHSVEEFFSKALLQGLTLHYKRLPLDEIQNQQKLRAKFK